MTLATSMSSQLNIMVCFFFIKLVWFYLDSCCMNQLIKVCFCPSVLQEITRPPPPPPKKRLSGRSIWSNLCTLHCFKHIILPMVPPAYQWQSPSSQDQMIDTLSHYKSYKINMTPNILNFKDLRVLPTLRVLFYDGHMFVSVCSFWHFSPEDVDEIRNRFVSHRHLSVLHHRSMMSYLYNTRHTLRAYFLHIQGNSEHDFCFVEKNMKCYL